MESAVDVSQVGHAAGAGSPSPLVFLTPVNCSSNKLTFLLPFHPTHSVAVMQFQRRTEYSRKSRGTMGSTYTSASWPTGIRTRRRCASEYGAIVCLNCKRKVVIYQPVVLFPNGIFTLDISPETRNREQVSRLTASPAQGVRLVMALAKAGRSLRCSYCQQLSRTDFCGSSLSQSFW